MHGEGMAGPGIAAAVCDMGDTRGFTILELLMVTAVLGIVAAMAIPAMNNAVERNKVFTTAELVAAQVREARLAAITRNAPVRVRFNCAGGRAMRLLAVTGDPSIDNASNRCDLTQPTDGSPVFLPENVTLSASSPLLEVDGRGFITSIGGTMPLFLSVNNGSHTRTVAVTGTGRVRTPTS